MLKRFGKSAIVILALVLLAGCASSNFRPTREGEPIQLIVGTVAAPGSPWFMNKRPYISENPPQVIHELLTGYNKYDYYYGRLLTAGIGPIGTSPEDAPMNGNEAILVYSKMWKLEPDFSGQAFDEVKQRLVEAYARKGMAVTDVKDISQEYADKLKFWTGSMFALAYKAAGVDYRVMHAFALHPSKRPNAQIVNDFSFIRMEKADAQDHFGDYISMLKSARE